MISSVYQARPDCHPGYSVLTSIEYLYMYQGPNIAMTVQIQAWLFGPIHSQHKDRVGEVRDRGGGDKQNESWETWGGELTRRLLLIVCSMEWRQCCRVVRAWLNSNSTQLAWEIIDRELVTSSKEAYSDTRVLMRNEL